MSLTTKAFQPPMFGKFGTDTKDLFKKKYDFERQLIVKNALTNGVKIETAIVQTDNNALRGVFKSTIPVRSLGKANGVFESEFHTVTNKESKSTYKFDSLAKNVSLKVGLTTVKPEVKGETPDFAEGYATAEAEYKQEYFAGSVGVRSNGQKTLVDAQASLGYDFYSIGGKVTVDVASKEAPSDFNLGAEYRGADFVASAYTEKKHTSVTAAYWQRIGRKQNFGASATFGLTKPTRTLTFGTDYEVDVDTGVRAFAKIDSTKDTTVVGVAVTNNIHNPSLQLGIAAETNISATGGVSAGKFGFSVTVGDF